MTGSARGLWRFARGGSLAATRSAKGAREAGPCLPDEPRGGEEPQPRRRQVGRRCGVDHHGVPQRRGAAKRAPRSWITPTGFGLRRDRSGRWWEPTSSAAAHTPSGCGRPRPTPRRERSGVVSREVVRRCSIRWPGQWGSSGVERMRRTRICLPRRHRLPSLGWRRTGQVPPTRGRAVAGLTRARSSNTARGCGDR